MLVRELGLDCGGHLDTCGKGDDAGRSKALGKGRAQVAGAYLCCTDWTKNKYHYMDHLMHIIAHRIVKNVSLMTPIRCGFLCP